jgi:hypothetical protein
MSTPNEQRPGAFRCVLPDIVETCDGCRAPIAAGEVFIVACPKAWTPTVIGALGSRVIQVAEFQTLDPVNLMAR